MYTQYGLFSLPNVLEGTHTCTYTHIFAHTHTYTYTCAHTHKAGLGGWAIAYPIICGS